MSSSVKKVNKQMDIALYLSLLLYTMLTVYIFNGTIFQALIIYLGSALILYTIVCNRMKIKQ
jgi:hypothetical protein